MAFSPFPSFPSLYTSHSPSLYTTLGLDHTLHLPFLTHYRSLPLTHQPSTHPASTTHLPTQPQPCPPPPHPTLSRLTLLLPFPELCCSPHSTPYSLLHFTCHPASPSPTPCPPPHSPPSLPLTSHIVVHLTRRTYPSQCFIPHPLPHTLSSTSCLTPHPHLTPCLPPQPTASLPLLDMLPSHILPYI